MDPNIGKERALCSRGSPFARGGREDGKPPLPGKVWELLVILQALQEVT